MSEAVPVYTIGHSTRTLEQFLALLAREGVRHLLDVRRFPASRRYPHFESKALAASLEAAGIGYEHVPALGGRRTPAADSRNPGWRNASFRAYADHMSSPEFQAALESLLARSTRVPTVVMCSEAVPWRCHRTLIADALLARGRDVRHIMAAKATSHALTAFAVVRNGRVEYPGEQGEDLFSSARVD